MSKHAELIARLEAAEVGSREFDWLVAGLMGDIPPHRNFNDGPPYTGWRTLRCEKYVLEAPKDCEGRTSERWVPSPVTTSLDASLALAERVLPGWFVGVQHNRGVERASRWSAYIDASDQGELSGDAYTPALALCIAILRALDAKQEGA